MTYYAIYTCTVSADPADDYGNEKCLLGAEMTLEECARSFRSCQFQNQGAIWVVDETDSENPKGVSTKGW
jgi:hypothetical protein